MNLAQDGMAWDVDCVKRRVGLETRRKGDDMHKLTPTTDVRRGEAGQ